MARPSGQDFNWEDAELDDFELYFEEDELDDSEPAQVFSMTPQDDHAANNNLASNADPVGHMENLNKNNFPGTTHWPVNLQQVTGVAPKQAIVFVRYDVPTQDAIPKQNQLVVPVQYALPTQHVTGQAVIQVAQEKRYRRSSGAIVVPKKATRKFGRLVTRARTFPAHAGVPSNTDRPRKAWDQVVDLLRKQGWLIVIGRTYAILLPPEVEEKNKDEDNSEDEDEDDDEDK